MTWLGCAQERPLDKLLRQAAESRPRPIEGRLSVSPEYRPWSGTRSAPRADFEPPDDEKPVQRGGAGSSRSDDLHSRGLLRIYGADLPGGLKHLERAAADAPTAALLADLSAAYLAMAEEESLWLLVDAAAAASAALERDEASAPASFNLALALQKLSLVHEAQAAWQRYRELETNPEWLVEADTRRHQLAAKPLADRWSLIRGSAIAAATSGDLANSFDFAREYPRYYRELVERELLPNWSRAFGNESAAGALATAKIAAAAVAAQGEKLYLDAVARIEKDPENENLAEAHGLLAQGLAVRSACSEALPFFEKAAERLGRLESPMAFAARLEVLICRYRAAPKTVEPRLRELDAELAAKTYPTLRAKVKSMLGLSLMNAGLHSEAMASYREAIDLLRPSDIERSRLLGLLDEAHFFGGDRKKAWAYRLEALAGSAAGGDRRVRHATLMTMAKDVAQSEGGPVARLVFREMLANAREWGEPGVEAEILLYKIPFDQKTGSPEVARDIAACEAILPALTQQADRERLACELEIVKAEAALATDPAAAASLLEPAIARLGEIGYGLLDSRALLGLGRARVALGDGAGAAASFDRALEVYEERREKTDGDRERIAYFATAQEGFDAMIRLQAIDRGDARTAFLYSERIRARGLRDRQPAALKAAVTEPLQSRLDRIPAEAVVLSFVVLPERLLVFRLETGALSLIVAPHGRAEVADLVAQVRRAFQNGRMEPAKKAAGRAFEVLLAEAMAGVAPEKELFLMPDRELHGLPFSALLDTKTGRFVVEDHAVTIVSSLEAAIQPAQDFTEVKKILVVGDPAFAASGSLAQLPGAASEAREIAALYGGAAELLTGPDATASQILKSLPGSDIFHLAAHVQLDPRDPLGSLILSAAPEPPLRTSALDGDSLQSVKLVYLSACDTAPGFPDGDREGAAGLVRAVQRAGIPVVVATLWPVDDQGIHRLSSSFYFRLVAGERPLAALRSIQLRAIEHSFEQPFSTLAALQLYTQ